MAKKKEFVPDASAMRSVLAKYADDLCEGWCERSYDCAHFDDCGGCLAHRTAQAIGDLP